MKIASRITQIKSQFLHVY